MNSVYLRTAICNIRDAVKHDNPHLQLDTLQNYLKNAQNFLDSLYRKHNASLVKALKNDEEFISYVVHGMIKADLDWEPNKGHSILSHRYKHCMWAIRTQLKHMFKSSEYCVDSLNRRVLTNGTQQIQQHEVIPNKLGQPIDVLIQQERDKTIRNLLNTDNISERDRRMMSDYFFGEITYRELGEKYGVSKARAQQIVSNGTKKIKDSVAPKTKAYLLEG